MRHRTFLEFKRYRYLKLTAALLAVVVIAYAWHQPPTGAYGGTWLGYTLGTLGGLIIGLLLWLGVRKRQYRAATGSLLGWLSAHVYLGTALLVIVTLHTGFELGWNVHTLAYALMVAVITSGFYGVYAYVRLPRLMTDNLGEDMLDTLLLKIADLDNEARRLALTLPNEINALVLAASQGTRIGGSTLEQLSGRQAHCPTEHAVLRVIELGASLGNEQAQANRSLSAVLLRKQALLRRARRDVAYKARLDLWLYVHVPLSIALLVALVAHVVSVFFYW